MDAADQERVMGVSIEMRPGTIMRSKGDPTSITPGLRSQAASMLREIFGDSPMEIDRDHEMVLETLARGASLYAPIDDNMWMKILEVVRQYGAATVTLEY